MKTLSNIANRLVRLAIHAAAFAMLAAGMRAQDTTTASVRHHTSSYKTEVRNAKVVYVSGNDLVLKLENGKVEHLTVPDSDRFLIDGKSLSVYELKPGTSLTQTITTTTTPRYVKTVRIIKGKIWQVMGGNHLIVTLPGNINQPYIVPRHATVLVDGKKAEARDLKRGMSIEATIVTDQLGTVVTQDKTIVGQAPPPATPPMVGVLLIQPVRVTSAPAPTPEAAPAPVTVASEQLPADLPKTGSPVPLIGLLGVLAVAASLGLGVVRRRFNV
jgi:LPXTG-motif cell wall-anchored protein